MVNPPEISPAVAPLGSGACGYSIYSGGEGVLEIKYPRSIAAENPTPTDYQPLSDETGLVKKGHQYHY